MNIENKNKFYPLSRVPISYIPFYDDSADYNTNAKSYYDYLARYNKLMKLYADLINRLIDREIRAYNTESIENSIEGNWKDNGECIGQSYDDVIVLKSDLIVSHETKTINQKEIKNGIEILGGAWSPDYLPLINEINQTLEELKVNTGDNTININTMRGINLNTLEKDVDYTIEFYNGFYSPNDDLIVSVGDTSTTLDINISSHSTKGFILKHDGDLREKTELSLRPEADYPDKCNVFSIELIGKYTRYKYLPIALDNSSSVLWHISPKKSGATWDNVLTPHNKNGKFFFNWRQITDGYSNQLKITYPDDELSLSWGNVDSKITVVKEEKNE